MRVRVCSYSFRRMVFFLTHFIYHIIMYGNIVRLFFSRYCPPVFAPMYTIHTNTRVPNFSRIIFPVGVQKITSGTNPFSIGVTCDTHTHTRAHIKNTNSVS